MSEANISGIMDTTMEKLRSVVDSQTIIGEQILIGDITIIPVSKVSFGIASGGTDFASKTNNSKNFGGGGGAGATVSPVCFLVIRGNEVKVLSASVSDSPIEKAVTAVPEVVERLTALFKKDKTADNETV